MIPFKINNKQRIYIPTTWEDLTVKQVEQVANEKEPIKILEIITGLGQDSLEQVFPYLEFIMTPLELDDVPAKEHILIDGKIYTAPDIKEKTIGQKILFQSVIKNANVSNNILFLGKDLFCIYFYEAISGEQFNVKRYKDVYPIVEKLNFTTFYSTVRHLIEQFEALIIKEKDLNIDPTPEQIQAGIKMFGQLGEMNTIDILAGGDPLKYAEIEKLEYNIVYWKLFKNKLNHIFEKNYKEVTKP